MDNLELLKRLDGNTFRLFVFLTLTCDDKRVCHNTTVTTLLNDLSLGEQTVRKILRALEKDELIEVKGHKHYIKLL